jgi:putative DNA primase/helicase
MIPVEKPSQEWPEPQSLTTQVEPEPYPVEALPPILRAAVEEVQGFVKAPVAMVASSAIGAVSLVIQAYKDIKRAERLTGPVGVFLLTIGDSGERKSTCDTFFFQAIRDHEAHQAELAGPTMKAYKAAVNAIEAKAKGIRANITTATKANKETTGHESELRELEQTIPDPPRVPRLIYSDVTQEELKRSLAKGWPSGGVISSEAGTVFGGHGMAPESIMRSLGTFNQLWDGADLQTDRRSTESYTVRGARLTIVLGLTLLESSLPILNESKASWT